MSTNNTAGTAPKNGQVNGNSNGTTPPPNNQVTVLEKTIADNVLNKIKVFEETGSISIPQNYSVANALRAAWLIILETKNMDKRPALDVCTKESVANALLKMVVWGLNPLKRQCSFIVYGNSLTCQREYAGTMLIAKRDAGVTDVEAFAVFKDDVFEFIIDPKTRQKIVTKHEQTLESMATNEVKGAYAVVTYADGTTKTEIMSMAQIQAAWNMGQTKGNSPAHKNFPDQMACKTVINRALKVDINSSDDGSFFSDPVPDDKKIIDVKHQIVENANKKEKEIGFDTETGEVYGNEPEENHQDAIPPAAAVEAEAENKSGQLSMRGF